MMRIGGSSLGQSHPGPADPEAARRACAQVDLVSQSLAPYPIRTGECA